jgi:transposase-like protein
VIGVIQRGGKVRLQVIDRTDRKTLHAFIKEHTAPDTEVIVTDNWKACKGIGDHDTKHEIVNHSTKEYVRGDAHTNGIENVWSLLKRSVTGTYHKLSIKHLDAYLDELEWRFNNRDNSYLFRNTLIYSTQRI